MCTYFIIIIIILLLTHVTDGRGVFTALRDFLVFKYLYQLLCVKSGVAIVNWSCYWQKYAGYGAGVLSPIYHLNVEVVPTVKRERKKHVCK
jgi:hypothetical protein